MRIIDDGEGVIIELYARAPDGDVFSVTAGDSLVGNPIPIGMGGIEVWGQVISAETVDDGKALKIGVKLDGKPPKRSNMLDN